jgi:hypothetical protein
MLVVALTSADGCRGTLHYAVDCQASSKWCMQWQSRYRGSDAMHIFIYLFYLLLHLPS